MKEQDYHIDGIDIKFFKNPKARNISITIKPFKGVRVSIPRYVTYRQARSFAKDKLSWIKKNLIKIKKAEEAYSIFNINTSFSTRKHKLEINHDNSTQMRSAIKDGKITIRIPLTIKIECTEAQLHIRGAIEKAWKIEAKKYLPIRMNELAFKHDLAYNKLAIKNTRSRWGSCSSTNNINLSLHLMRLPNSLIDYVILHELAHTKVKNHSNEFWKFLDTITNEKAKLLDKKLKNYRIRIY